MTAPGQKGGRNVIHEVLAEGAENARTAGELQNLLGLTKRQLTKAVEAERRAGWPICANTTEHRGYYLAESREEMEAYCKRLKHRQREIGKTRRACLASLDSLPSVIR